MERETRKREQEGVALALASDSARVRFAVRLCLLLERHFEAQP